MWTSDFVAAGGPSQPDHVGDRAWQLRVLATGIVACVALALDAIGALTGEGFGYGGILALVGIPLAALLAPRVIAAARPVGFIVATGVGGPAVVLLYVALQFGDPAIFIAPTLLMVVAWVIASVVPVSLVIPGLAIFLTRRLAPRAASLWPATAALTVLGVALYGYAGFTSM